MPRPSEYVSTLVGTQSEYSFSTGNTYPAVALPWGMNFWTPQTGEMGSGWAYTYGAHTIRGLKQTHQPSPWINDYGQFSIMPVRGRDKVDEESRQSWFSHQTEEARPYYYSVYLADHDIKAEIAPTERAAIMRFTFPESDESGVVIDAFDRGSYIRVMHDKRTVVGYTTRNSGGVPDNFKNWFIVRFDRKIRDFQIYDGTKPVEGEQLVGEHALVRVGFETRRGEQVTVRAASSFISQMQAVQNLEELGKDDFETVKAKTATFSIQFKPQAIVAAAGSPRRAENFVIPFACVPRTTVNSASQSLSALVRFSFSEPTVTVDAPVDPVELIFISGVPVPRRLELSCRANFTTLQTSKLAFAATQEMVDAYNAANQADCLLLPADCYSVDAGTFDAEALTLLYGITVDASALDPDHVYLLPLKLAANDYTVTQDNMYYVKVTIQEIQFTVNNTDRYEAATRLAHPISLDVALNGALADDVPVEFTYDPSKVADYNASKGKAYEALDASRVTVTNAAMTAGTVRATATVSVDMAGIAFDDGKEYVLPFVLDESKLPQGSVIMSDEVVYVRLKRTLYGSWSNRNSSDDLQKTATSGWSNSNWMKATTKPSDTAVDGKAYPYVNCYYSWSTGYHWYVAWDEVYGGDPNKRVVHAFSKVTSGYNEAQQVAQTMDYGSYFDMETGTVFFDFQYYWNDDDKNQDKRQTIQCYLESPLTVAEF